MARASSSPVKSFSAPTTIELVTIFSDFYYAITLRYSAQIGDSKRMVRFLNTPIRRLEGVAYWVIEDPEAIYDFINTEVKKEWEADARSEGRGPREDSWLKTLSKRKWSLAITKNNLIKLDPDMMNYANSKTGYDFAQRLAKRSEQLQREINEFAHVIWPVIVKRKTCSLLTVTAVILHSKQWVFQESTRMSELWVPIDCGTTSQLRADQCLI